MQIRYLGHSSFEIEAGNRTFITDPWLDPRPRDFTRHTPPAATADSIRKADIILLSHEHFDHCSPHDVGVIVSRTNAYVIGPEEALAKLNINQRLKVPVSIGDSFNLIGVDIEVFEARHPQSANPLAFVVKNGGQSFFFAGDTYDFGGLNGITTDVAFLPIGGTFTMDVLSALTALKRIRCKYVVPMHYNTFDRIHADVHDFHKRVKAAGKPEALILEVGESVTV